ncbi:hypothetical protein B0H13DRAFT_1890659 [Mycena leptocephala]|nr:hypothetical protein B0H13DRAFT_1890659 [Mycena leptocephala]
MIPSGSFAQRVLDYIEVFLYKWVPINPNVRGQLRLAQYGRDDGFMYYGLSSIGIFTGLTAIYGTPGHRGIKCAATQSRSTSNGCGWDEGVQCKLASAMVGDHAFVPIGLWHGANRHAYHARQEI